MTLVQHRVTVRVTLADYAEPMKRAGGGGASEQAVKRQRGDGRSASVGPPLSKVHAALRRATVLFSSRSVSGVVGMGRSARAPGASPKRTSIEGESAELEAHPPPPTGPARPSASRAQSPASRAR